LIQRNLVTSRDQPPTLPCGKGGSRQALCQRQNDERGGRANDHLDTPKRELKSDFDFKTRQEPSKPPAASPAIAGPPEKLKSLSPHKFRSTLSNNNGPPAKAGTRISIFQG
jgi:hypothetical protein